MPHTPQRRDLEKAAAWWCQTLKLDQYYSSVKLGQDVNKLMKSPATRPKLTRLAHNEASIPTLLCNLPKMEHSRAVSTAKLMRVEMFPLFSSISNFLQFLIAGRREEPLIRTLPSAFSSSDISSKLNSNSECVACSNVDWISIERLFVCFQSQTWDWLHSIEAA